MLFRHFGQQAFLPFLRKRPAKGLVSYPYPYPLEQPRVVVIQRLHNYQTNQVFSSVKLAGHCRNSTPATTPPPPFSPTRPYSTTITTTAITTSTITTPTPTPTSSSSPSPSPSPHHPPYSSTSSISSKIASHRTAQLARHFSSSPPLSNKSKSLTMATPYSVRKVAAPNTLEHRVYIEKDGVPVSPFHDVPLYANQEQTILNMVVEIPRWTNAKLEVIYSPKLTT